jgi:6-phosphogluconate dehydrogenase (decarboxylating)
MIMELGVTGLGRMGTNLVRQLLRAAHQCFAYGIHSDSGEGRWTIAASIDVSVPVLSAAHYERFSSRGQGDFADKVLSALRYGFGDHEKKAAIKKGGD